MWPKKWRPVRQLLVTVLGAALGGGLIWYKKLADRALRPQHRDQELPPSAAPPASFRSPQYSVPLPFRWQLPDVGGFAGVDGDALQAANQAALDQIRSKLQAPAGNEVGQTNADMLCDARTAPLPAPDPARTRMRLLRVPKTGSSFWESFIRFSCGNSTGIPAINSPIANCDSRAHRASMYREECAWTPTEIAELVAEHPELCNPSRLAPGIGMSLKVWLQNQLTHAPLMDHSRLHQLDVVTMLRSPSQRLVSAFYFDMHRWGLPDSAEQSFRSFVATERGHAPSLAKFVRYPSIRGCATKMLGARTECSAFIEGPSGAMSRASDGETDAEHSMRCRCQSHKPAFPSQPPGCACAFPSRAETNAAVANLAKLAFVGLQEEWNSSVCLFHRLLGGQVYPQETSVITNRNTQRLRRRKTRPRPRSRDEIKKALGGFVDIADELVYGAALKLFDVRLDCVLDKLRRGNMSTLTCANIQPT